MASNNSWQQQIDAKQKLLEPAVERAIAVVRKASSGQKPGIQESFFYGAIGIDPKHLVIWFIFTSETDKSTAVKNGLSKELEQRSREALRTEGYPAQAIDQISVAFASDEEIRRAGGFRAFFA